MSIIRYREDDGTLDVMASGYVTRNPELKGNPGKERVKFAISYGKKKYLDCEAWADSDAGKLAGCLEKSDTITVYGTERSWEYGGKTYTILTVDAIHPVIVPNDQSIAPDAQDLSGAGEYPELKDDDEGLPF